MANTPEQDQAMLEFWAAVNGMTPQQYASALTAPAYAPPDANTNPYLAYDELLDRIESTGAENQRAIDDILGKNNNVTQANNESLGYIRDRIAQQGLRDDQFVQQTQDLLAQLGGYVGSANAQQQQALDTYRTDLGNYSAYNTGLVSNLGGLYGSMSTPLQSTLSYNPLTSQAAQAYADPAAIAAQNEALSFLSGAMGGALDYRSQAAQAYANVQDIANQQAAAAGLQAAAGGSNDVNFWALPGVFDLQRAAQGGLNVDIFDLQGGRDLYGASQGSKDVYLPDIDGMRELRGAAFYGDNDVDFDSLQGISDLLAATKGSQDVHVGQEDPEAYQAMVDALRQFKGLTSPTITDAERFLYEQARLKQEQDERGLREATAADLRQRGMSGSGQELGQSQLASQRISQNRLLSDLGANANAIARSMQALEGYGDLSSTMSAQANDLAKQNALNRLNALGQYTGLSTDVATGNQDRRLNAMGMYTDISSNVALSNKDRQMAALQQFAGLQGDLETGNKNRQLNAQQYFTGLGADVETGNQDRRLNAQNMASQAYAELRAQGFDEEYARGVAADTAAAHNQATRLQGGISYGNLASTARDQSFNEAFSRGTAADQTAQFNETNRVDVQKYNQDYAQRERDSLWNRGLGLTNAGLTASGLNATNTSNAYNAQRDTTNDIYSRNRDVISMTDTSNLRQNTLAGNQTDRQIGADKAQMAINSDWFNTFANTTGLGIQNNNNTLNQIVPVTQGRTQMLNADIKSGQARDLALRFGMSSGTSDFEDFMNGQGIYG